MHWTCSFEEFIPALFVSLRHSTHEEIRESVRVKYWVGSHNPARTSSGLMFELWISDGFEWSFAINFLYPKFAVLPRSKQLMPVTMKFRLDFLVRGVQGHLLRHLSTHEEIRVCKSEILSLELQSSSNIVRFEVPVANQWLIRMIFRRKLSVPKICSPFFSCNSCLSQWSFG